MNQERLQTNRSEEMLTQSFRRIGFAD